MATRIKNNIEPIRIVAQNTEYKESLTDGLKLCMNPYATVPIDVKLFEDPGIWPDTNARPQDVQLIRCSVQQFACVAYWRGFLRTARNLICRRDDLRT
jgi:hypothetical protein